MSETVNPNPSLADERRRVLKEFLSKKAMEIHIEDSAPTPEKPKEPSRIVQVNADGSVKPTVQPESENITFRAFPDGSFCKFTGIPQKPGYLAICLNTAAPGQADILHQVGIVKQRAVADLICESINFYTHWRSVEEKAKEEALEEVNETAVDIARLDDDGAPATPTPEPAQ
jgi:hypothetical protein